MTCNFTSFPTVLMSYQDGGRVKMEDLRDFHLKSGTDHTIAR